MIDGACGIAATWEVCCELPFACRLVTRQHRIAARCNRPASNPATPRSSLDKSLEKIQHQQ
ncbi:MULTISPECIES: hypothetical protein [Kocuria]|uniref:Uncharacterized protein n=1 Tax=Kocuria subflava TaxID=1736139 RepID=A0A846TV27_9MICC|nr:MULTISPECIES: hypothetical protein [Kocuria]NKE09097.1 hypothetical protein [Kocuria subflava]